MHYRSIFVVAVGLSLAAPVAVRGQGDHPSVDLEVLEIDNRTREQIADEPDRHLTSLIRGLYSLAPDGVVSRPAIARKALREKAKLRATFMQQIMQFDFDGDGALTADEVAMVLEDKQYGQAGQFMVNVIVGDKNQDGALSAEEIENRVESQTAARTSNPGLGHKLMGYDADQDGQVDPYEVARVVAAIVAAAAAE